MARADCSELALKISDWAMSIGAETGAKDIDSVVKEMQKTVPAMNRQMVVDSIVEATQGRAKQTDELTDDLNTIKREARLDKNTRKRISELQKYLDEGIAPPKSKRRVKTASDALQALRDIRDGLNREVGQSEPVRQAKLLEQIRKLEDKIERGDIQPKQKQVKATEIGSKIERLEFEKKELRDDIKRRLNNLKPKNIWDRFADKFNVARSLITTLDLSAVLRQGGFFALGRPKQGIQAFKAMNTALASKQGQFRIEQEINRNPWRALASKAKLFIAPTDGSYKLSAKEEEFQSEFAKKLPIVGKAIEASERAYVTFLNKQRMDMFATFMETLTKNGEPTLQEAQAIANFVNMATGRGNLGSLEKAAVPLNTIFFAPRYVASRFQLLYNAVAAPVKGVVGPKELRRVNRMIAGEYARYLVGLMALYAMAEGLGEVFGKQVDIEWNPTSSDFGKIRIGNTRLDPLSGVSQVTVLLSRVVSGQTKSTTTGMTTKLRGTDKGFNKSTVGTIGRFLRTKLSPLFGTIGNVIEGETIVGEEVTPVSTFVNLTVPLSLREIKDSIQEQGLATGTAVSMLAILGMGVQTYGVALRKTPDSELIQLIKKNTYKRNTTVRDKKTGKKRKVRAGQPHKNKEAMVETVRKELLRREASKKNKQSKAPQNELKNVLDKAGVDVVSKLI
jgi:hypothetical protein